MELNLYLLLALVVALLVIGYLLAKLHRIRNQLSLIKETRDLVWEPESSCTGTGKRPDEADLL